jgi:hypothetical protein
MENARLRAEISPSFSKPNRERRPLHENVAGICSRPALQAAGKRRDSVVLIGTDNIRLS